MRTLDVYKQLPLQFERASGVELFDTKGRRYLDFYSGHGVISIGHSHPHWVSRLTEQLGRFAYYSNVVPIAEQQALCDILGEVSGHADYEIFLCNSGAEAIENAVKMASTLNGGTELVAMRGSFHGRTMAAALLTDAQNLKSPLHEGLTIHWINLGDEAALEKAIHSETAAVLIEGIQGVGGVHEGSSAFWQKAMALCEDRGAFLIADEIQSGFGRTGDFFAFDAHGVKPHIICTAKGMGNGFPVAAAWLREGFEMPSGSLGSTFGGGPLAATAARAVCEVLKADHLMPEAKELGLYLKEQLEALPGITAVRGRGLMIGVDLEGPCAPLRARLLEEHGILTGTASDPRCLRLLPPLSVSRREADELIRAFRASLENV